MLSFILICSNFVGTLVGAVGCVFLFFNPIVTLYCAVASIVCSFVNVVLGDQNSLGSELLASLIGYIVSLLAGAEWYICIAGALCIESFALWLIGLLCMALYRKR